MSPIQASKKINEKQVHYNLEDKREKQKPKYKLGDLVRTDEIFLVKETVQIGLINSIQLQKLYTFPSYRINYLPERYNEALLKKSKLTINENNRVIEK